MSIRLLTQPHTLLQKTHQDNIATPSSYIIVMSHLFRWCDCYNKDIPVIIWFYTQIAMYCMKWDWDWRVKAFHL